MAYDLTSPGGSRFETVQPKFLSKRVAVDTEYSRGPSLVAVAPLHHDLKKRALDLRQNHRVDLRGFFPVQMIKVTIK